MLKSVLKQIYDFNNVVVPEELLNIEITREEIKNALDRLAEKYLSITEVYDGIVPGDIIAVDLKSNISKYNNKTQISEGLGYFNKKLEDNLIGMKKGDIKTINIDENSIDTKIISVKRRIIPKISDELVKKEKIDDVNTIEEYEKYIYDEYAARYKNKRMNEVIEKIKEELLNKSEFELDDEDINSACSEMKKQNEIEAEKLNISFEEEEQEIASEYIENPTIEESEKFLYDLNITTVKTIAMGASFAKKFGIELDRNTYEKEMKSRAEREKTTIEYQKQAIPYFSYLEMKYMPFIDKKIKDYYKDKIKFNIKPISCVNLKQC